MLFMWGAKPGFHSSLSIHHSSLTIRFYLCGIGSMSFSTAYSSFVASVWAMPGWLLWLLGVFLICWATQLWFLFFRFARLAFHKQQSVVAEHELPVSIVICTRNNLTQLQTLLGAVAKQNYSRHEVIVVDDRSDDDTYDYLLQASRQGAFKLVRINQTPDHINPKKYALTIGIKAARHPYLLLTDADCQPRSAEWISHMVAPLHTGAQIVLGYSPYKRQPGVLNLLVRFDSFFTALQYFSFALAGQPYMGVGRNLAYRRDFFFANKGFSQHAGVVGGDDDLFVNRLSGKAQVQLALTPESFVFSDPKETFGTWFRQKLRHLSVGKHYKLADKVRLGLLISSLLVFYALFVLLLFYPPLTYVALVAYIVRLILHTAIVAKAARRLQEEIVWYQLPLLDAWLPFYYLIFGLPAILTRKIQWK